MPKENKPLSESGRQNLYEEMGALIEDCCPLLEKRAIILRMMQEPTGSDEHLNRYKLLLEVHLTVLYAIIEVATVMRADLRSKQNAEKRENLKYLVFVIHEFYKSLFLGKKGKRIWDKAIELMADSNDENLTDQLKSIEDNIQIYMKKYFTQDSKEKRDAFVHYDENLLQLYQTTVAVYEEELTQMTNSFLAIAAPINRLLLKILLPCDIMGQNETLFKASARENALRNALKDALTQLDSNIIHFTQSLDRIMKLCRIPELLAANESFGLNDDAINQINEAIDWCKPGVLAHFFYIDISVAMKGFLCSESRIESLWHLTRMYLIIYEAYKKLFDGDNGSLWNKYIRKPLEDESKHAIDLIIVEVAMKAIMQDKVVENIRQGYVHIRQKKEFRLTDLMTFMADINAVTILSKSLFFIKSLAKLLTLSKDAMNVLAKDKYII